MSKIGSIEFKKLKRVSPSQYYSMKSCAYKSLLAEAFDRQPLLPISPNAYLGTVLHKMLDLISRGELKTEIQFKDKFDSEITLMEESLLQKGYNYFVPLHMNIRDFGLKKIQLKKHFKASVETPKHKTGLKLHSEHWFESNDKLIGGKIDLIIDSGDEIEIIDFKTGAITEDTFDDNGESYQEVKNEYQIQLKLYAYLYFEVKGKFPTRLSLIDLGKQKFNIQFSENECRLIFEEAKSLLSNVNQSIETAIFDANPSATNCIFCLYRPACSFFIQFQASEDSLNDVCGILKAVAQYTNGNVSVFIDKGNKRITVTGFEKDKLEYFNNKRNTQVNLYNLKKESAEYVYSVTKTTKIYE